MVTRAQVLDEAKEIVTGDRQNTYGDALDNFSDIARLWSAYLQTDIGAEDVACMMALFKIARIQGSCYGHIDSWIDAIGYLSLGAEIARVGVSDND